MINSLLGHVHTWPKEQHVHVKEHVRVHVRHVHVHAHVMFTSHVGREGATCWTVDVLKEQHVGRVNMLHSFGPPSAFGRVALSYSLACADC